MKSQLRVNGALVVCFLRGNFLEDIFQRLVAAGITDVCVWMDGPRSDEEAQIQKEIVDKISSWENKFDSFSFQRNSNNLGLSESMLQAIDWYFSSHELGIILEDDILFGEEFVSFINLQMQLFNSKDDVLLISGHNPNPDPLSSGYVLSNYPLIWGWCTSRTKWTIIRDLIVNPKNKNKLKLRPNVNSFWKSGLIKVKSGSLSSWALPFAYQMRCNDMLAINPHVNLIKNVGFDDFATHTDESSILTDTPIQQYFHNPEQIWETETPDKLNRYLEKYVYGIGFKHYFLPIRDLIISIITRQQK